MEKIKSRVINEEYLDGRLWKTKIETTYEDGSYYSEWNPTGYYSKWQPSSGLDEVPRIFTCDAVADVIE